MAQRSYTFDGTGRGDNAECADWQCSQCPARFASKEEAEAHIRQEHHGGTFQPCLNATGARVVVAAVMMGGPDPLLLAIQKWSGVIAGVGSLSEQQALSIVRQHESEILSMMGLKAEPVEATEPTGSVNGRIGSEVSGIWDGLPIAFDVLDAMIEDTLSSMAPGVVYFERSETTAGTAVYNLSPEDLVSAVAKVERQQRALERVKRQASTAQEKVNKLIEEYNQLLCEGASDEVLKRKLAEINAAEQEVKNTAERIKEARQAKQVVDERVGELAEQVGALGSIKIRKQGDNKTSLRISGPRRPLMRDFSPEEQKRIAVLPAGEERRQGVVMIDKMRQAEQRQRLIALRKHQGGVIRGLFQRLEQDTVWKNAWKTARAQTPTEATEPPPGAGDSEGKRRRPTLKTQEHAEVFRRLKDEHPEWTQWKVAMEAGEELGMYFTADSVRNAYRAMGWKWERADRIR